VSFDENCEDIKVQRQQVIETDKKLGKDAGNGVMWVAFPLLYQGSKAV
jgi:hypothetical protein